MTETLTGFAALAVFGFMLAFGLLLLFMVLVQPIWCVVDCAVDNRRNGGNKAVWIIVLLVFWGVANWFYGAFSAEPRRAAAADAAGVDLDHRAGGRVPGAVLHARRVPPGHRAASGTSGRSSRCRRLEARRG